MMGCRTSFWEVAGIITFEWACTEKESDSKDSFYEELKQVFNYFPKYHMKILLGDFNAKFWNEDIFRPATGNKSLHHDTNESGVRIVYFATSKI